MKLNRLESLFPIYFIKDFLIIELLIERHTSHVYDDFI